MLRGLRHRRSGFAQALAAFALLAMAMRAMVPTGLMLAPAQDGRFLTITLCSGHAQAPVLLDLKTGAIVDANNSQPSKFPANRGHSDAPCAFAAAAHLAPPEAGLGLKLPLEASAAERSRPLIVAPGRGLAAPPPWATGPPFLS